MNLPLLTLPQLGLCRVVPRPDAAKSRPEEQLAAALAGSSMSFYTDPTVLPNLRQSSLGAVPVVMAGDPVGFCADLKEMAGRDLNAWLGDEQPEVAPAALGSWSNPAQRTYLQPFVSGSYSPLVWPATAGRWYRIAGSTAGPSPDWRFRQAGGGDEIFQLAASPAQFDCIVKATGTTIEAYRITQSTQGAIAGLTFVELPARFLPMLQTTPAHRPGAGEGLTFDGSSQTMTIAWPTGAGPASASLVHARKTGAEWLASTDQGVDLSGAPFDLAQYLDGGAGFYAGAALPPIIIGEDVADQAGATALAEQVIARQIGRIA